MPRSTTPILIDPRTGKLTSHDPAPGGIPTTLSDCDRDRMNLAHIDDAYQFRRILDEANRANTSFYPIDPRGLVVFDEPIVPPGGDLAGPLPPMVPLTVDAAHRTARITSLRTLAEATDGMAIVDSNDLAGGLRRVVDDLTSYYLLGYYSTNPKLDGKFRRISVRVTRPGVQVRARRGYLAATQSEVEAARGNARGGTLSPPGGHTEPSPATESDGLVVETALAPLREIGRDVPLRLQVAAGWKPDHNAGAWIVGEVPALEDWKAGGTIDLMLTSLSGAGATLSTAHVQLAPGARAFRTVFSPASGFIPGEYAVLARGRSARAAAAAANNTVRFVLPAATGTSGAVIVRRGPSTGNRDVPTADARFRRNELLRVEVPAPRDNPVSARLLDRNGKVLNVPVSAGLRDDADGWRWSTAELALAPLAVGDYIIEISGTSGNVAGGPTGRGDHRVFVAFRVVP